MKIRSIIDIKLPNIKVVQGVCFWKLEWDCPCCLEGQSTRLRTGKFKDMRKRRFIKTEQHAIDSRQFIIDNDLVIDCICNECIRIVSHADGDFTVTVLDKPRCQDVSTGMVGINSYVESGNN